MAEDVFRYLLGLVGSAAAADAIIKSMTAASRPPQTILNLRERFSDPEYTVVVQPPVGPKGPQPMVVNRYGDWIVDPYGTIQNPAACPQGQSCVGQKTQTAGIQEAINYVYNTYGGGKVYIRPGTYNVQSNVVLQQNISLTGAGKGLTILNMNTNKITTNGNASFIKIEDMKIAQGGLSLATSNIFSVPSLAKDLVIRRVRVENDIQGAQSPWYSVVINGYYNVYLEDFDIVDTGTPSSTSDALGLGANVRLTWIGGKVYAPSTGGAGINWEGGIENTSQPLVDYPDYSLQAPFSPSGTTGMENIDYYIEGVDIVGDVAALSIYNPAYTMRFVSSAFYATNNSGTLFGGVAIQGAYQQSETSTQNMLFNTFEISFDDCVFVQPPNEPAIMAIALRALIKISRGRFYTFSNYIPITLTNTYVGTEVLVDNSEFYVFNAFPSVFNANNSSANYKFVARNIAVHVFNSNGNLNNPGGGGNGLFLPSPTGQSEVIDVEGLVLRSYYSVSSSYPWVLVFFYGNGTKDTPGSYVKIGKFLFKLDIYAPSPGGFITSTEQEPNPERPETWSYPFGTPSMPSSGSAVMNTYPVPALVYLYGGTVTEVQITKAGTTYTVFSNSSGVSMSGQAFRLDPGDSITITYSSAPTWVWVPAYD